MGVHPDRFVKLGAMTKILKGPGTWAPTGQSGAAPSIFGQKFKIILKPRFQVFLLAKKISIYWLEII